MSPVSSFPSMGGTRYEVPSEAAATGRKHEVHCVDLRRALCLDCGDSEP